MTIKTNPKKHQFDVLALQKCTLEALEWSEFNMKNDFPCVTYDALKESVYIRYKAALQLTTQDIRENDKFAPNFNIALNTLLKDLIKRHVIKSLGDNLLKAQFRLWKPATLPVDVFNQSQLEFIHDYVRGLIDDSKQGMVDNTVIYSVSIISTQIFGETNMLQLMDIAAKTKQTL